MENNNLFERYDSEIEGQLKSKRIEGNCEYIYKNKEKNTEEHTKEHTKEGEVQKDIPEFNVSKLKHKEE